MTIEVLSRLQLPVAPVDPDDVARRADLRAHFDAVAPVNPYVGQLWATPTGALSVWTGTTWLSLTVGSPQAGQVFDDGTSTWDDGSSVWPP